MKDDSRDSRPSSRRRKSFDEGAPAAPKPAGTAPADETTRALKAKNEALQERLKAAEEVLRDLENRCRKANEIAAENRQLRQELDSLRAAKVDLEEKVAARAERGPPPESRIWGYAGVEQEAVGPAEAGGARPDSQAAELVSRLNEAGRRAGALAAEVGALCEAREELAELKPRAMDTERQLAATRTDRNGLATQLEKKEEELTSLRARAESDRKDAEARDAEGREERQKLAAELAERDGTIKEMRARAEETDALLAENSRSLEDARASIGELESSSAALAAERDGLAAELKKREEALASLRTEGQRKEKDAAAQASVERDERERLAAEISKRDGTIEQMRAEGERAGSLLAETRESLEGARTRIGELESSSAALAAERDGLAAGLKEREEEIASLHAEAKRSRKDSEAEAAAARKEREKLAKELAGRDGAMAELRAQAEKAGALAGENRALQKELDRAHKRLEKSK